MYIAESFCIYHIFNGKKQLFLIVIPMEGSTKTTEEQAKIIADVLNNTSGW